MYKKLLSLLLALCLVLAPAPMSAWAQAPEPPQPPSRELTLEDLSGSGLARFRSAGRPWQDGSFSGGVYQGYYAQLSHTQQVVYELLAQAFAQPVRTAHISFPAEVAPYFPDQGDDWANMQDWMDENFHTPWALVIQDHPEINWTLGSYETQWADWVWEYDQSGQIAGGTVTGLDVTVTNPWCTDEIFENPQLLTQALREAKDAIGQPRASRAMTAKAIHDYVCGRITYQVRTAVVTGSNGRTETVYYDQLAFSGLTYPYQAVCAGYTMAFKLLCDQYGIPCVSVVGCAGEGSGINHAWNYVQLEDNRWYAVDTTWDDDPLSYGYFLIGSDTVTYLEMPFSQDHVLVYEYIDTAPDLNPSAYPYVEAELWPSSAQAVYGESVALTAEDIRDRLGRPLLEGTAALYAQDSGQLLAAAPISGGRAELVYDTADKALPAGEHSLFVRCEGGEYEGAVLGSFSLDLDPAPLTARLDTESPLTAKDFDGSAGFSGLPLILEGVRPEDEGLVTARADGNADSFQAGERVFASSAIAMDGPSGGFYQVAGQVSGPVTIRKIRPGLSVSAFPAIQDPGKKVSLTVRLENGPGGFPDPGQIELLGPEGVPLGLAESAPGVYKAEYTLPLSLEGGESLSFTAAVTGADNYLDASHADCAPAGVTAASRRASFVDTDSGAWYRDAVSFVYNYGLMSGVSETRFGPDATTSRGMIATILYQMAGSPAVGGGSPFSDVPGGKWYAKGVAWAASEGIVSGYGGGRFGPGDPITREQFALMLYKFAGSPEPGQQGLDFADAGSVSGYARKAMSWAAERGIISGKEGKRLDPKGRATRAQAAQMIMRYYEKTDR